MKKKLVTIKNFLLNFFGGGVKMCDKMAISAYILKIVEKDPFLRLQMRAKHFKITAHKSGTVIQVIPGNLRK